MMLSQNQKIVMVKAPVADCYAAGSSDIVDVRLYQHLTFVALMGVAGGADRITFTVDACDDNGPTNTAQCPLYYRIGSGSLPDTLAALTHQETAATGTGSLLAAACVATQHIIEVEVSDLLKVGVDAATAFVTAGARLTWATSAAGGIVGAVLAILSKPRIADDTMPAGLL